MCQYIDRAEHWRVTVVEDRTVACYRNIMEEVTARVPPWRAQAGAVNQAVVMLVLKNGAKRGPTRPQTCFTAPAWAVT